MTILTELKKVFKATPVKQRAYTKRFTFISDAKKFAAKKRKEGFYVVYKSKMNRNGAYDGYVTYSKIK